MFHVITGLLTKVEELATTVATVAQTAATVTKEAASALYTEYDANKTWYEYGKQTSIAALHSTAMPLLTQTISDKLPRDCPHAERVSYLALQTLKHSSLGESLFTAGCQTYGDQFFAVQVGPDWTPGIQTTIPASQFDPALDQLKEALGATVPSKQASLPAAKLPPSPDDHSQAALLKKKEDLKKNISRFALLSWAYSLRTEEEQKKRPNGAFWHQVSDPRSKTASQQIQTFLKYHGRHVSFKNRLLLRFTGFLLTHVPQLQESIDRYIDHASSHLEAKLQDKEFRYQLAMKVYTSLETYAKHDHSDLKEASPAQELTDLLFQELGDFQISSPVAETWINKKLEPILKRVFQTCVFGPIDTSLKQIVKYDQEGREKTNRPFIHGLLSSISDLLEAQTLKMQTELAGLDPTNPHTFWREYLPQGQESFRGVHSEKQTQSPAPSSWPKDPRIDELDCRAVAEQLRRNRLKVDDDYTTETLDLLLAESLRAGLQELANTENHLDFLSVILEQANAWVAPPRATLHKREGSKIYRLKSVSTEDVEQQRTRLSGALEQALNTAVGYYGIFAEEEVLSSKKQAQYSQVVLDQTHQANTLLNTIRTGLCLLSAENIEKEDALHQIKQLKTEIANFERQFRNHPALQKLSSVDRTSVFWQFRPFFSKLTQFVRMINVTLIDIDQNDVIEHQQIALELLKLESSLARITPELRPSPVTISTLIDETDVQDLKTVAEVRILAKTIVDEHKTKAASIVEGLQRHLTEENTPYFTLWRLLTQDLGLPSTE